MRGQRHEWMAYAGQHDDVDAESVIAFVDARNEPASPAAVVRALGGVRGRQSRAVLQRGARCRAVARRSLSDTRSASQMRRPVGPRSRRASRERRSLILRAGSSTRKRSDDRSPTSFPGGTSVTLLDVYDDAAPGRSARRQTAHASRLDGVLRGDRRTRCAAHAHARRRARDRAEPGSVVWFTPGTIHRAGLMVMLFLIVEKSADTGRFRSELQQTARMKQLSHLGPDIPRGPVQHPAGRRSPGVGLGRLTAGSGEQCVECGEVIRRQCDLER